MRSVTNQCFDLGQEDLHPAVRCRSLRITDHPEFLQEVRQSFATLGHRANLLCQRLGSLNLLRLMARLIVQRQLFLSSDDNENLPVVSNDNGVIDLLLGLKVCPCGGTEALARSAEAFVEPQGQMRDHFLSRS